MTSIVRFHALSGAQNNDPLCYLLELDGCRILLDVGWNEDFNLEQLEQLKEVAPTVDAVLISHPDLLHLGAYPYAFAKLGLKCPVYATIPVENMGQLFMYDIHHARANQEDFDLFTLDDVDAAFAHITKVNYKQAVTIPGTGIQMSACAAGHMVGGSVWQITKDDENIVYAVDYNHRRERHLNSTAFDFLTRPYMLITNTLNARYNQEKRKVRDADLLASVLHTLRNNGDVLLVADTAGRSLELLQLLDQLWGQDAGRSVYPLVYLNNCAFSTLKCARTVTSFMWDAMQNLKDRDASSRAGNEDSLPFPLDHVQSAHTMDELKGIQGPKIILVAQSSLEAGFSRELFLQMANDAKNQVLFTTRPLAGSLGDTLLRQKAAGSIDPIIVPYKHRIKLQGEELATYRQAERERLEALKAEALALLQVEQELDAVEDGDAAGVGDDQAADGAPVEKKARRSASFFKTRTKQRSLMFNYAAPTQTWDDYGQPFDMEKIKVLEEANAIAMPVAEALVEEQAAQEAMATEVNEVLHDESPPTKVVEDRVEITPLCQVKYIDFEGLADGDAMLRILSHIRPRSLMLIHGDKDDTEFMSKAFEESATTAGFETRIETPKVGDVIDMTTDRNIFQVKLRDALVSQLKFRETGGYQIAWVDGVIQAAQDEDEGAADTKVLPELVTYEGLSEHHAVFVGDLMLSELRDVLQTHSITATFLKGTLICGDKIQVSRDSQGLLIDGPLCPEYYAVRDVVYSQFASA
eukprot:m.100904 g.100904  ORF g.100904 m.100904 type:complete len:751 (+) comp15146_c0_seq2:104-2356(+)